ncbi:MAG: acetyltransferase [uncultured archaeon A07HR67]|nr:MAG: acetyltransferase [uncultured archaeon A07HR67]
MDVRRPKTDADVEGLIRVHGLAWREAYDGILPDNVRNAQPVDPTAEDVDRWRTRLDDACADAFVAVVAGSVRGFVDVRWREANTKSFVDENEAELKAIYVHPDSWGDGIGTALLDRGLDALPDWITTIRLETLADNAIGVRFYEARGFERVDTTTRTFAGEEYPVDVYAREL